MRPNPPPPASIALDRLFLLCTIAFLIALLHHHYQLVTYPAPLDYNEAGMLTITDVIARGGNPHAFESQPVTSSVYPVLYNMIVAPFSLLLGNTLPLHRAVAGVFLLGACAFWFFTTRRKSGSAQDGLAVSALLYGGLLYYSTPIASPNGLGLILFYASLGTPWLCGFSNRSLFVAVLLGVLSFYGKQYFIASMGYIALYLFLTQSKLKGILFGCISVLVLLASVSAVTYTSPYFLDNTVFAVGSSANLVSSNKILFAQLLEYSQLHIAVLLVAGLLWFRKSSNQKAGAFATTSEPRTSKDGRTKSLLDMNTPLLNIRIDYFWYCFACSLTVIAFSLGRNPGNHLSYLFQFMSPFLLIACLSGVSSAGTLRPACQLLLVFAFYTHYGMLSHDFSIKEKNWDKIRQIIAQADDVYASNIVLEEVMRSGKEVYENGHTRYFHYAENKPDFFGRKNQDESITGIWNKHINRIYQKIATQEFDVIILDQWQQLPKPSAGAKSDMDVDALLKKYYYRSEVFGLSLANRPGGGSYSMQIWRPVAEAADTEAPVIEDH